MDGTRKTQGTQEESILCDPGNDNVRKLCKSKKEKSKKRKSSLDEFQRTDVGSVDTSLMEISAQGCEIGSKKTKLKSDSLTSSATVNEKVRCGEKKGCPSTENASHCEVSSSSSALTVSKRKKSRHQKAVSDFNEDLVLPCDTTVELLTNECEEPSTSNGRKKKKKKSKRDEQMIFTSPLLFDDDDLLATIKEEDELISDKRTEASTDLTNSKTNSKVCSLSRKSSDNVRVTASHEIADCPLPANLDEFSGCENEGSIEKSKKLGKKKKGRVRKEAKSKLAVNVELSDVEKPTETAFSNQVRRKSRTGEEFAAKESKSSVNSLIDTDAPLAEKQPKTKTNKKRKGKGADESHVITATSLPPESPAQPIKTEDDDDDDVVSESPIKKEELLSETEVETIKHEGRNHMNELFWVNPAATGAGVPRPNKNLFRRKMRCPVDGCPGRSTRINRHILDCHPELEVSERKDLLDYVMENPSEFLGAVPAYPVVPALKRKLRCPVDGCFGLTIRLRRHLITCHWDLTPAERDELWEKVTENPSKYTYTGTLTKSSTSESKENTDVVTIAKRSSAGIPRPNFKVRSRRRKQDCPVAGCHGAAINMRRHLMDCHSEIVEQHEELLEKLVEERQVQRAAKRKKFKEQKKLTYQVPLDTTNCDAVKEEIL